MATESLLRELRQARATFGVGAEERKRDLIAVLGAARLSPRQLKEYHDDLLFLVAFPGALATRADAIAELERMTERVRRLPAGGRANLEDSGIAGTVSRPNLAWPVARRFIAEALDIEWSGVESPEQMDALVAHCVSPAERDAYEGGDYSVRQWIALAKRDHERDLAWLVREGAAVRNKPEFADAWDAAQVPMRWALGDSSRSATHARLPRAQPVLRRGWRRLSEGIVGHVERPLQRIRRVDQAAAMAVVDLARAALATRGREVHAMNYPNRDEVYLADLGEGAELALIGVAPERRLTLEANYGYLLMSNGVPIGYGGVSPLFRQANTGINVFDPFRGSEAAFLWAQTLRAFRTLFGVRRFVINGYQFGAGNAEAIASGAFWFYLRLGFRPSAAENVKCAARELARLRREPGARTPAATLRRLARGDLFLDLSDFDERDYFDEPLLTRVGALVARRIAAGQDRSHRAGEARLIAQAERALGWRGRGPARPRAGRLAPYAALLDLARWPDAERRALGAWLRTKEDTQELSFAREAGRHGRFFRELAGLAQQEVGRERKR